MSTPALVTTTLQNIVRLELAVKASIHDINTSDGPLDSLQRINADARKNVQEIKKALDDLETFAKGTIFPLQQKKKRSLCCNDWNYCGELNC